MLIEMRVWSKRWSVLAVVLGMMSPIAACGSGGTTITGGGGDAPVASSGDAAVQHASDSGAGDAKDASTCGEITAGSYQAHYTNNSGASCGVPDDGKITLDLASDTRPNCTHTLDPKACTLTIACHDVNGRFLMDDKMVYELGAPGAETFVAHSTSTIVDTLQSMTTICLFDVSYTKQ